MNVFSFVRTSGRPLALLTTCTNHHLISALVVCLFISDLIQGISGMVTLAWAKSGQVSTGSLCLTQAIMLHIGDVGTAYWNAVIAIHTFWTVVLGETPPSLRCTSLLTTSFSLNIGRRTTTVGIACLIAGGWSLCFFVSKFNSTSSLPPY
jgi:hypothetical protein